MKKIGYISLICLLLVIVMFNLFSMFDMSFFHYRIYKIASGSMKPNLNIGDVILIKDNKKVRLGDVVTYKKNNIYITHRVVEINKDNIITKGDNNSSNDEAINKSSIVGVMVSKLEWIDFIGYLFNKPFTWVLIFLIGIVCILLIPKYIIKKGKIIDKEVI